MVEKIVDILDKRGKTITFAESCTGGKLASTFVEVAGVSKVFNGSIISYSNEIKSKWLGVKEDTLIRYGAVSHECVNEMLNGALKLANSNYAVAISGIAGPSGGSRDKPVGTVFIGVKGEERVVIKRFLFNGDRVFIQNQAVDSAILLLKNIL
jgi:nicotinamide-nucleotide amidase